MKRTRTLWLLFLLLVPTLAYSQSAADKSWNAFWSRFSTAVKTKNRAAIKSMASTRFTWHDVDDRVSAWLKNLDKSRSWYMVQNSVDKGTVPYNSGERKPWRVTRDDHLLFVYEGGRWRFYGIMGD